MLLRRLTPLYGFIALALLAAACGSTGEVTTATGQGNGNGSTSSGLNGTTGGTSGSPASTGNPLGSSSGATGGIGTSTTGGSVAGSTGSTGGTGGTGSTAGSTGGTPGGTSTGGTTGTSGGGAQIGQGVTPTEILIGRSRLTNAEAANKAFGNNVTAAPTDQYDKAMVDYVNSHGGVAGRKLKLNYYTVDGTGNKSTDQIEGEECAQWTQDNHVYAVLTGGTDNLRNCLAKKGVPQVYENVFSNSDNQTFSTFRSYYEINTINLSHLGDVLPDQLAAGGYFSPGAKLGLLTFDGNQYMRAVSQHLKPALAKRGLKFVKEAYVKTPNTTQATSEALGSLPNYVLQFKGNVDHLIIFGDSGAALLVYFDKAANSQQYSPTYGLTSASGPQAALDGKLIQGSRLQGSVVAGWNPTGDVGVKPYTKYGAGYKLCASIMEKAGVGFAGNTNNTVVGSKTCDTFFFLAAAINRGAPNVTLQSFLTNAESLGGSYVSALTYDASITSSYRDGVSALATSVYDGSCTCFKYYGSLRQLR